MDYVVVTGVVVAAVVALYHIVKWLFSFDDIVTRR